MTFTDEMNFAESELNDAPSYPVVFGISFTPKVSGILAGLAGVAGAAYIALNLAMPAWEAFQQKRAKQTELQAQIEQKKASIGQIDQVKAELTQVKRQNMQVLGLFANEKTLDTLLLDLNRVVEAGNGLLPGNAVQAKLKKFEPTGKKSEIISDGSLGTAINGKLKRSSINIQVSGTYDQTQTILRNIERLQPLLIVKEYKSELNQEQSTNNGGKPIRQIGPVGINSSFQLQALMPLNPEEVAAANQAQAAAQAAASGQTPAPAPTPGATPAQ